MEIECLSCFNDRRFVLRGIDLIETKPEKLWCIHLQCCSCLTCFSVKHQQGGMLHHIYENLKKSVTLMDHVPAKIRIEHQWAYDWNQATKSYDLGKKMPVRPMENLDG